MLQLEKNLQLNFICEKYNKDGWVFQETIPLIHKGWRPCLLAISLDNYLTRYDLDTGQTLERVFLSNCYKYR